MKNFQRSKIHQSPSAGQGKRNLSFSQQQSVRRGRFRRLKKSITQQAENQGGKAELPPCVQNALSEMPRMRFPPHRRSYFSQNSGVGCRGRAPEAPARQKTLPVPWVTCKPWLTPARQAGHRGPHSPCNISCSNSATQQPLRCCET